jgi:DNA-binding NarL/FixJ family response regulator
MNRADPDAITEYGDALTTDWRNQLMARVLIADDHTLIADAFQKLLEPAYAVIGTVSDGRALIVAARDLRPDVIVLDIAMPLLNGLDAARAIKKMDPSIKLVFVTVTEDADIAAEAFRAGGSAYVLKRSAGAELMTAMDEVLHHRSYMTPLVTDGVVQSLMRSRVDAKARTLTTRQCEVLQLLAEGKSMKEAADILQISTATIAFHKYRIMEQLRIKTSAELIRFAVHHHLVS